MKNMIDAVKGFFSDYESQFNKTLEDPPVVNSDAFARSFTTSFVEASPLGIMCIHNDRQFLEGIPQGFAFYKSIGTQAMKIAKIEVVPLNPQHAMAKVKWNSSYRKKDGDQINIQFDVIYFMQVFDGEAKIFAYISGDEEKELKDKGVV